MLIDLLLDMASILLSRLSLLRTLRNGWDPRFPRRFYGTLRRFELSPRLCRVEVRGRRLNGSKGPGLFRLQSFGSMGSPISHPRSEQGVLPALRVNRLRWLALHVVFLEPETRRHSGNCCLPVRMQPASFPLIAGKASAPRRLPVPVGRPAEASWSTLISSMRNFSVFLRAKLPIWIPSNECCSRLPGKRWSMPGRHQMSLREVRQAYSWGSVLMIMTTCMYLT